MRKFSTDSKHPAHPAELGPLHMKPESRLHLNQPFLPASFRSLTGPSEVLGVH